MLLTPRIWPQGHPAGHPLPVAAGALEDEPTAAVEDRKPASASAFAPKPGLAAATAGSARAAIVPGSDPTLASAPPESVAPAVALRAEPRRRPGPGTGGTPSMPGVPPVQDPASPAPDSGLIVAPDPLNPPRHPFRRRDRSQPGAKPAASGCIT